MSTAAQYGEYAGRMSNINELLAEIEEVAAVYKDRAETLQTALGQVAAVGESLNAERGRDAQALVYIEAASAGMNAPEVMLPAHADMASATGQLAAARYEVNQSQARLDKAKTTTEQQEEPLSRNQQACTANAADLTNLQNKLQELGSLAAEAKNLAQPE